MTLEIADYDGNLSSTTLVSAVTVNPARTLTATAEPSVGGTVDGDGRYSEGDWAQLLAATNPAYAFIGWGGDASGRVNPLSIQMDDDYDVIAYFHRADEVAASQSIVETLSDTSVVVTCVFRYPETYDMLELTWQPVLPAGWEIQSVSGEGSPVITPDSKAVHYATMPAQNPFEFTYEILDMMGAGGSNEVETTVGFVYQSGIWEIPDDINPVPDPLALYIAPTIVSDDTDNDGLPNTWELEYFLNSTGAVASADSDDDGQSNLQEFIGGSDPTNAASMFCITDAGWETNSLGYVVQWNSISNRYYSIHWSSSLTNGFNTLETDLEHPQGSYTDTTHSAESDGFYTVDVRLK